MTDPKTPLYQADACLSRAVDEIITASALLDDRGRADCNVLLEDLMTLRQELARKIVEKVAA